MDFSRGAAYAGGEIVPVHDAAVSILDTGFSRSDVTYDVVAVWDGAFFRLDDHLARFERSCAALRLTLPHDRAQIAEILMALVRRSGLRRAYVEVICTRGFSPEGLRDPRTFTHRFHAYAIPYVWILPEADAERGMHAVVARTTLRIPPASVDPTVKNFHWGDLTRALFEAYDRGGTHPILLDGDGHVTEGAGYNVFAVAGGRVLTPEAGVLEGVTRSTVLQLAEEDGLRPAVLALSEEALRGASELFATSTAGGVMPITTLDGAPVGDGGVGPVTHRLRERYWAAHGDPRWTTPVDYDA
jgi:branched-chain amino acid aminotransferase